MEEGAQLSKISRFNDIPARTLSRWVKNYREKGLSGLVYKKPIKKDRYISENLKNIIEGLALKTPPLSVSTIHRYLIKMQDEIGEKIPSYYTVYRVVKEIEPA